MRCRRPGGRVVSAPRALSSGAEGPPLAAGAALLAGLLGGVWADDAGLIDRRPPVGVWEVVRSAEGGTPPGTTLEFLAGGKATVTRRDGGMEVTSDGAYSVDGDRPTLTVKGQRATARVRRLTARELVTETEAGRLVELERRK